MVHEKVRKYPCDLCERKVTTKKNLMKHMRASHSTDNPSEGKYVHEKYKM